MTEVESLFGFTYSQFAVAGGLALLLLVGAYAWMIAPVPPRRRMLLLAIRVAWTGMLLWCLFLPVRRSERVIEKTVHPHVVTLLDVSASMAIPDGSGKSSWLAVRDAATQLESLLKETQDVSRFSLGEGVRSYRELPRPEDRESHLVSQLTQVVSQEARDAQPTVVFLLSDGQDTSETQPSSLLSFLAERRVQIIPIIPATTGQPPPLARVDKLSAPTDVTVGQSFQITADIRFRRGDASAMSLVLERDGAEVARKAVGASRNNTVQVAFAARVEKEGFVRYGVRLVEDMSGAEASRLGAIVHAHTQQTVRVLYVQGTLDWEYRFVRQAIAENPSLQLDAVSRLDPNVFLRQSRGGTIEQNRGDAFAALRSESLAYDVVVLANVNPALLDAPMQKLLSQLVLQNGGGILFFSGNSVQAAGFYATELEQILPVKFLPRNSAPVMADEASRELVRIKSRAPTIFEEEVFTDAALQRQGDGPLKDLLAMRLTSAGQLSEVWRDAVLGTMVAMSAPPATFLESARVASVKPAATVLATHPKLRMGDEMMPVLVTQNIGAGRSAFLGVDALWRWRMRSASESREYDRFWQQMFLWLGGRMQRSELTFDRGRYQPGELVKASLQIDSPDEGTTTRLLVRRGDESEQTVALSWLPGNERATAQWKADADGQYLVSVRQGERILSQQLLEVRRQDLEREYSGLNEPLLQQLAKASKGQVIAAADLEAIKGLLQPRTEKVTQRSLFPLWDSPWLFAGILVLCTTEWVVRRKMLLT